MDLAHIIERQFYHFFMGGAFLMIGWFVFRVTLRKLPYWHEWLWPALAVTGIIFLREPADVAAGGWLPKSYIDYTFWWLGMIAFAYGVYRLLGYFGVTR